MLIVGKLHSQTLLVLEKKTKILLVAKVNKRPLSWFGDYFGDASVMILILHFTLHTQHALNISLSLLYCKYYSYYLFNVVLILWECNFIHSSYVLISSSGFTTASSKPNCETVRLELIKTTKAQFFYCSVSFLFVLRTNA